MSSRREEGPQRRFRPTIEDALEDRAVPSRMGIGLGVTSAQVGRITDRAVSIRAQAVPRVMRAFTTFRQTCFQDVRTILVPPGMTNPAERRPAFDQAVTRALATLNASLSTAVAGLPA